VENAVVSLYVFAGACVVLLVCAGIKAVRRVRSIVLASRESARASVERQKAAAAR
jgi:hypothetical protein